MYKCRICGETDFEKVIDMGKQPKVNSLLDSVMEEAQTFPLVVVQCAKCGLVQILKSINANEIYRQEDYLYYSSNMPGLGVYFQSYADKLKKVSSLKKGDLVVEIGSNDGIMLKNFDEPRLGVDPSTNVVVRALKNGVTTISDFFSHRLAKTIVKEYGKAKLIYANNCIAHIDNIHDIMNGVTELLSEDGVFAIECNYWGSMVDNFNYALIYHDHFSYFTVSDWKNIALMHGLTIFDAELTPAQGGSLRVFLSKKAFKQTSTLIQLDCYEREKNFKNVKTASYYRHGVMGEAKKLRNTIMDFYTKGKIIAGYGAAAKGFSLLSLANIGKEISYFVDDSPSKQGKYTPVHKIPVVKRDEREDPDVFVITAPNYSSVIIEKEETFLKNGGLFILHDGTVVEG